MKQSPVSIKNNTNYSLRQKLILTGIIAVLFIGIYIIFYTNLFRVQKVSVTGNHLTSESTIANLASTKYIFSSVKLAEAPLTVDNISISKKYWQRELQLEVKEREQYALWCVDNNCWWFDRGGIAFLTSPLASGSLIFVTQTNIPAVLGQPVLSAKFLDNYLAILTIIKDLQLPLDYLEISNIKKEEVIAHLDNPALDIYFSLRFSPEFTREAISSLRQDFSKLNYIDLRSANRAFYK